MSCSTEINACPQTVSDQCVRYTGPSVASLGITTGDTLSEVEAKLVQYLTPLLTGVGDAITIAPADTCTLITQFLTGTPNSTQLFRALSKAVCDLQTQVTTAQNAINTLNADYTISCLDGVTASSDTHLIVQAIINKLCTAVTDLTDLELEVSTNYVLLSQLNELIAAYLQSQAPTGTQNYLKMVPYTAVEYYGSLANFDGTGAGIPANNFQYIYLCNGNNGTPDKRGRVPVGAIVGVPGPTLDAAVNPANAGNPNYGIGDGGGANTITLTAAQIPAHTHAPTVNTVVTETPHYHFLASAGTTGTGGPDLNSVGTLQQQFADGGNATYRLVNSTTAPANLGRTNTVSTGVTVNTTVTIANNTGGGGAHSNIQPVRACYYIMYIPAP